MEEASLLQTILNSLLQVGGKRVQLLPPYLYQQKGISATWRKGIHVYHLDAFVRKAVEAEKIPHAGGCCPWLTISLGIASVNDFASSSPAALLAQADAALYRSKRAGRNCTFENQNGELLDVQTWVEQHQ